MAVSSRIKRTSACGRAVGKLVKSGVGERVWLAGAHHFQGETGTVLWDMYMLRGCLIRSYPVQPAESKLY